MLEILLEIFCSKKDNLLNINVSQCKIKSLGTICLIVILVNTFAKEHTMFYNSFSWNA